MHGSTSSCHVPYIPYFVRTTSWSSLALASDHYAALSIPGAQAASATGAARDSAQEAVRRAEENLQAARDKAAETASSSYQATKGKAQEMYVAGRGPVQAAIEEAEAAAKAAREKVLSMLVLVLSEVTTC